MQKTGRLVVRWRCFMLVPLIALSACGSDVGSSDGGLVQWCKVQASLVELPSFQFAGSTKAEQLTLIDRYVAVYTDLSKGPKVAPAGVQADYSKMRDVMIRVRGRVDGGELLSSFLEGDADMAELVRVGQSLDQRPVAGCAPAATGGSDSLPGQIGFTPVDTSVK